MPAVQVPAVLKPDPLPPFPVAPTIAAVVPVESVEDALAALQKVDPDVVEIVAESDMLAMPIAPATASSTRLAPAMIDDEMPTKKVEPVKPAKPAARPPSVRTAVSQPKPVTAAAPVPQAELAVKAPPVEPAPIVIPVAMHSAEAAVIEAAERVSAYEDELMAALEPSTKPLVLPVSPEDAVAELMRELQAKRKSILPETIELDMPADDPMRLRDESEFGASTSVAPSQSDLIPAAPLQPPKDPDKALANVALGMLRLQNWPCQEEDGYKSFIMTVNFKSPAGAVISSDTFRVFAETGILYFEQCIIELPQLEGVPILEMLNEINQRTIASVLYMKDDGVYMRGNVIPRAREDGVFSVRTLLQSLRQMYHDRRHALSLIRSVCENKFVDLMEVSRAFAHPLAAGNVESGTLNDLADLARFSGYHVAQDVQRVYLSRDSVQLNRSPVRVIACLGYIRGWVTLGDVERGKHHWTLVPPMIKDLIKGQIAKFYGGAKTPEVFHRLNELNSKPSLARYVANAKAIMAVAQAYPTDMSLTVEQFRIVADRLLDHATVGVVSGAMQKVAC